MPGSQSSELSDTPDAPGSATAAQHGTALPGEPGSATVTPLSAVGGTERYELLEEIARGGMGVVFRARDRSFDREVGLKTLLKVPVEGSVIAARFHVEAHITGQ